ncbi:MAG: C1 family peptidase [Clostridia bacterium]|nr:C1 family peptidase [Clostridia bacterium]
MKNSKKVLSVILAVLMLLTCVPVFSFAADGNGEADRLFLIVEEDGRTTHWEDSEGNIVDLTSAKTSSSPKRAKAAAAVPEKYDAREDGLVTPVKYQQNYGNCWAFAATSCVESALIKKGITDKTVDLSEDHLTWFAKNSLVNDPNDPTSGDGCAYSDMYTAFNAGGTWMDSISAYSRGSGPVFEKDYPFPTGEWAESERYNAEFRVTDCSAIDVSGANMAKIKRAIMQYGSVKTSYYSHTGFYNITENNGSAYYYPEANGRINHDVTIVGWDDNYAIENFNVEYRPKNKGAWLVKNSWGTDSIQLVDGYFWMSYDESEVTTVSYYDAESKWIYDNTYQYDGTGSYGALFNLGRSSAYGSNVFTAKRHEKLNYVGFYSEAGVNYTIYIYKLKNQTDYPTSGTLVSTTYGAESYYGYHTAKLSTPVEVNEGDVFSVILQINMYDGSNAKIFTEGAMYDASFDDYQSYFGTDKAFMDMISPNEGYYTTAGNVCLKVMSKNISECSHNYTSTYSEATCTSRGGTTYTCSLCGDTYMENITARLDHTAEILPAVAPTCEETGLTQGKRCSSCNAVLLTQKELSATGHNWVGTVIKQPTCTEPGTVSNAACSVCGKTYSGTISVPAKGHTVVEDEATEPTCTDPGYSAGTHCSVCNTILSGHYIKWPSGHNEISVSAVAATCTEDGHKAGTKCSVCNAVLSGMETISAKGHSFGDWTAVEGGGEKRTCSVCGYTESKGAEGCKHNIVTDPAVAPTCTASGLTEGSHCSICGTVIKERETVPATGHKAQVIPAVAPTCTATGLTEGSRCSVCREILKAQETVSATGHMYGAWETEREATCTENGILKKTCTACGNVFRTMQAKKNHVYVIDAATEPTCTKPGYTQGMHCSSCNLVITAQTEIPALGHSYGEWETVKTATCTAEGEEKEVCSVCGDTRTRKIEKLPHTVVTDEGKKATCTEPGLTEGTHCSVCDTVLTKQEVIEVLDHTPEIDEAVAPTCTKAGLSMGSHCAVCGKVFLEQEEIPALGHSYGEWETVKTATCTAEGEEKEVCSVCGDTRTRKIEKLPHTESGWIVDDDASCVKEGKKHTECTACHTVLKTEEIAATGNHAYTDVTVAPTCTTKGYTTHTCTVCGDTVIDTYVDALGHTEKTKKENEVSASCKAEGSYDSVVYCSVCNTELSREKKAIAKLAHTEEAIPAVEATCTRTGLTAGKKCSVCGEVLEEQQTVPTKAHSYGEWVTAEAATCSNEGTAKRTCFVCGNIQTKAIEKTAHNYSYVVTAATCTHEGYTTHTCAACGYKFTDSQVSALGHAYGEWKTEKDATCTAEGVMARTCTRCSDTERKTVEKLGHSDSDNDGICDVCGEDFSKNCSCSCHSTNGFVSFLWKIKLFFIRIFGVQKVCACGKKHY